MVRVTDVDGDFAEDTLTIDIIDDVPTANADVDSVTEDGPALADGNVITGSGGGDTNTTDGVLDVQGADGAIVTGVAPGDVGADVNDNVGSVVVGTYGLLTIGQNGAYSYGLTDANDAVQGLGENETLTDVFTYTITDGDGDTSTTTLTITINGNDDPVVLTGLDVVGGELTLDEDDLPDGSSPNPTALTQSGSFIVDAIDGLNTLSVGGVEIFNASTPIGGFPITVTDPAYGLLTITGVTPITDSTGDVIRLTVDYSYVLQNNEATGRHGQSGEDSFTDSFAVVAIDTDGTIEINNLDITVVDDIPSVSVTASDNAVLFAETSDTDPNTPNSDTVDLNGLFNVSRDYAADGQGPADVAAFSVAAVSAGAISGLTSGGIAISLYDIGGNVVASTAATQGGVTSDNTVFTLSVDTVSGVVTLTQTGAVDQPVGQDSITLPAGIITASYSLTVEDADGDTATDQATIDLGGNIRFNDDEPEIGSNDPVFLNDEEATNPNGVISPGGTGDVPASNTAGTLNGEFGADGPGLTGGFTWLDIGAPSSSAGDFTYTVSPDGTVLTVSQLQNGSSVDVIVATLDAVTGDYNIEQLAPVFHTTSSQTEENQELTLSYQIEDSDGDVSPTGTILLSVNDDVPVVQDDSYDAFIRVPSFQTGFILDYSGSIDNAELATQIDAVLGVAQTIFNLDPAAQVYVTAFATSALNLNNGQAFTNFADLQTALLATSPNDGGTRPPIGLATDYSDGVEAFIQSDYETQPGHENQVFFISDGNPNRRGSATDALDDAADEAWQNYFDQSDPPFSITSIGVGDNINLGPLGQVDIDNNGDDPILVDDFDALLQALIDALQLPTQEVGNVITGDFSGTGTPGVDTPGADGVEVGSFTIGGFTYTFDGTTITIPNGASGTDQGNGVLADITTPLGGSLTVNLRTGEFDYETPVTIPGGSTATETASYQLRDLDGDLSNVAQVTINLEERPIFALGNAEAVEGQPLLFDLVLTQAASDDVVVQLGTADGSATGNVDYEASFADWEISTDGGNTFTSVNSNGQVTIPAGTINAMLRIETTSDAIDEGSFEDFTLTANVLSSNTFDGNVSSTGTIIEFASPKGDISFSTTGTASFNGITIDESDIGTFNGLTSDRIFNGDSVFSSSDENVDALHVFEGSGTVLGFAFGDGDLLLSTSDGATIGGVSFADEDVVLYDVSAGTAQIIFDGSAIGGSAQDLNGDLDAVSVIAGVGGDFDIVISISEDETVFGTSYDNADLIRWDGSNDTLFFDESTGFPGPGTDGFTDGENIDGVHVLDANSILLTTTGSASIGGLSFEDGDVVLLEGDTATLIIDETTFFTENVDIDALDPTRETIEAILKIQESQAKDANNAGENQRQAEVAMVAALSGAMLMSEPAINVAVGDSKEPGSVSYDAVLVEAVDMASSLPVSAFDFGSGLQDMFGPSADPTVDALPTNAVGGENAPTASIEGLAPKPAEPSSNDFGQSDDAGPSALDQPAMFASGASNVDQTMEALLAIAEGAPADASVGAPTAEASLVLSDVAAEMALDQLIEGFEAEGVTAEFMIADLGETGVSLLDQALETGSYSLAPMSAGENQVDEAAAAAAAAA
ncbi:MAG: DUF5801 repeats-in-toxin domain-containing protein [Pseudomonadota bacterium]